ncbi:MAG: hypothetical protein N2449_04690 [Bacteroidales bacterium]|nr:hypothetical protein [Bacteroidales bacterium]
MNNIDKNIIQFIKKHHVLNLAVHGNNTLWTASCFYAFWQEKQSFIFLSDEDTLHAKLMTLNPEVVGTIALETRIVGKIQGIQFRGLIYKPTEEVLSYAKKIYYKRFPYAIGHHSTFWLLELTYIKFTDNRLGFGKKIIWEKIPLKDNSTL